MYNTNWERIEYEIKIWEWEMCSYKYDSCNEIFYIDHIIVIYALNNNI